MLRFIEILIQNSMIMRVGHSVGQEAGHFSVCNYATYNPSRNAERDTQRDTFKEVFKESKNKIKDTCTPSADGLCVSPKILVEIYQQNNQCCPR